MQPADGRRYGRCASVSGFCPVDVNIIIGKYTTSYRRNTDGLVLDVQFFNHFCNQFVNYPVGTSRAVVHDVVGEEFTLFQYEVFLFYNVC